MISVILPTHNGSKYISRAIDSIISQTYKNWELIIVNDCSTDNTLDIISKYAKSDSRIRIINNEINKKLPASLNIGFAQAKGEYLTWTSDDNLYKENAFFTMLNFLQTHEDVDFVSCDMDWVSEDFVKFAQHSTFADRTSPITLSYICNVGACFMYKANIKSKIGLYNENTFCAEDWEYWCRIALKCKMKYLQDNLYIYVANTEGLSFTHREQADKMGEFVVNLYAKNIIDKYAKSIFDKIFTYGKLISRYPNYKTSLFISILVYVIYKIPLFIIKNFPTRKLRILLREKFDKI